MLPDLLGADVVASPSLCLLSIQFAGWSCNRQNPDAKSPRVHYASELYERSVESSGWTNVNETNSVDSFLIHH